MTHWNAADRKLSPGSFACMALVWLQPTDRALAGWAPATYPEIRAQKCGEDLVRWLENQVMMTLAETGDFAGNRVDTRLR